MGSCCSSEQEVAGQVVQQGRGATVVTGTNKKLKDFSIYEWSSDVPITAEQLQSDRNKYWETQPSYGGRVEVWQSLRLACESGQVSTAQAIIDSMNITVPTGKLTDGCYDELGAQCICDPLNMEEGSIKLALKVETNLGPSNLTEKSEAPKVSPVPTSDTNQIEFVVRLSTAKDFPISIAGTQTVGALKTQLIALSPDLKASKLLVLYLGKKLDDKVLLQDCRIKSKSIVQVMVM